MSLWMEGWIFPVVLGFLLGSGGYILHRFYVKPIIKYRRIKGKIAKALTQLTREAPPPAAKHFRALAAELNHCYSTDLPLWFQLLLTRRKEDPPAVAGHLMTLAKTKNPAHIRQRIEQIEASFQIRIKGE